MLDSSDNVTPIYKIVSSKIIIHLCVCRSFCLSICLAVSVSVPASVSICVSVRPSVVRPRVCLTVCLSLRTYMHAYIYIYICVLKAPLSPQNYLGQVSCACLKRRRLVLGCHQGTTAIRLHSWHALSLRQVPLKFP